MPDHVFGLSDGEFIAAYCQGKLTLEQTVLCIHYLANALDALLEENNKAKINDLKELIPEISEYFLNGLRISYFATFFFLIETQLLFDFQETLQQSKINPQDLLYRLAEDRTTKTITKRMIVIEIGKAKSDLGIGSKQLENGPLALLKLLGE